MASRGGVGAGKPQRPRVVGLGGSLAPSSTSLAALNVAIRGAREAGTDVEVFDIRFMNLPMYAPNLEPPDQAVRLCDAIYAAEGLIWSSPLYHGTISGSFKNALDWLELLQHRNPPYLTDKVVGLISSAGGVQGLQAVNTMEFVVRSLRGFAVPLVVPVARAKRSFGEGGQPLDERLEAQLLNLGQEVALICLGRRPLPGAEEPGDET